MVKKMFDTANTQSSFPEDERFGTGYPDNIPSPMRTLPNKTINNCFVRGEERVLSRKGQDPQSRHPEQTPCHPELADFCTSETRLAKNVVSASGATRTTVLSQKKSKTISGSHDTKMLKRSWIYSMLKTFHLRYFVPAGSSLSQSGLPSVRKSAVQHDETGEPESISILKNKIKVKTMKKSLKLAYSFAEMCIVMVVVAIFVALMANVVPHKPKDKVAAEAHGRFECYYDCNNSGGNCTLMQRMYIGSSLKSSGAVNRIDATHQPDGADRCVFYPPSYARYVIIDAVGGGGGGSAEEDGANVYGGSEGEFQSSFFASVQNKYYAIPGKPGAKATAGGDTTVRLSNEWEVSDSDADGDVLVKARGGQTMSSLTSTDVSDVESCAITDTAVAHGRDTFDCGQTPTCEVTNNGIKVSFCRTNGYYKTQTIPYKQKANSAGIILTDDPAYIINNVVNRITTRKCESYDTNTTCSKAKDVAYDVGGTSYNVDEGCNDTNCEANVLVYHDISLFDDYRKSYMKNSVWDSSYRPSFTDESQPSLYTMELTLDLGNSDDPTKESVSNFYNFVQSMDYPVSADKKYLRDQFPGNGGKAGAAGHTGAVLFLW